MLLLLFMTPAHLMVFLVFCLFWGELCKVLMLLFLETDSQLGPFPSSRVCGNPVLRLMFVGLIFSHPGLRHTCHVTWEMEGLGFHVFPRAVPTSLDRCQIPQCWALFLPWFDLVSYVSVCVHLAPFWILRFASCCVCVILHHRAPGEQWVFDSGF